MTPTTTGPLDLQALRNDTPGCATTYLNNGAAGLMPLPVQQAVQAHLAREANLGAYRAAEEVHERLLAGYGRAAELIGAQADEIAFVESGSRAWQLALEAIELKPGDVILTTPSIWGGNYAALVGHARRHGAHIRCVPCHADGSLNPDLLREMIDQRVRLIELCWAPSGNGVLHPAAKVGAIARNAGIPYLIDASQALGQVPLDVRELGCDLLAASGRKWLRAPRGTGLLYANRGFLENHRPVMVDYFSAPIIEGCLQPRRDARRFENAEHSVAVRLGLCAALDYTHQCGVPRLQARIRHLAQTLRHALEEMGPDVRVHDHGLELTGIVTFTLAGHATREVHAHLRRHSIETALNLPGYMPLAPQAQAVGEVIRVTPHAYNDEQDLARLLEALIRLDD
ncbi:aminotransferase class V-fold PLP-dependent enzyme [Pseudomonas sp. LABIM340]|uniref:Aminotransferase class V-fold PLP-dependent enzyme n=1 Tax=Pseudomonas nitroreducens TaxID=46680 RepID=A0A5R8ZYT7_PSENT|nr:aminotransferase class V-fold PLP-dependent enzyme [Pseudomonas nitroreducens]TLP71588.1 aminotransferase class V-fold PLP-dependent enzyme [Pseudomonas nitroreducens]